MIQPLWKTVWRFLKTLGIKPAYDPEETKIERDTCIPVFTAALFIKHRSNLDVHPQMNG